MDAPRICAYAARRMFALPRSFFQRVALVFLLLLSGSSLCARDVFVMLSGGASPLANNYSQYLQAKAVAKFFRDRYPADSVWTFFGAGNVEGQEPFFADVRKQYKKDGLVLESWVPGPLPFNRPAKREVLLKALREEILPAVRDGGTLFLFVGDHGSQPRGATVETTIDLWGIDPDPTTDRKWKFVNNEKITATELQKELAAGLGRGRVVFCMTQCYSGGYHFLGIPRFVAANPAWFTQLVPDWAMPTDEPALPLAAGFTATDYYSLAAGCDPDPDPDKWAGYERYVPENLLGLDLFTLKPAGTRRDSFFAAHVEATLVDQTIDKPHSTSERYLERWATLIEARLASQSGLAPEVQRAVTAYARAVETGKVKLRAREAKERQKLFARFTKRLAEQAPTQKKLLLSGTRAELEKTIGTVPPAASFTVPPAPNPNSTRGGNAESRKLWKEVLQPAWAKAVRAGEIKALATEPAQRKFEETLLGEEAKGRDLLFGANWMSPLLPHLFWASGGNIPGSVDATTAENIARWGAVRRRTIMQWARENSDPAIAETATKVFANPRANRSNRAATTPPATPAVAKADPSANKAKATAASATKTKSSPAPKAPAANATRPLQPKIAAERTLFYRRVLAAWAFLEAVDERSALAQVQQLTQLERTKLPEAVR
ncbi:MAG: hypothetical protein C0518_06600 [Opitutus sp.]|nr:hypothetical protein [Opitutus sp.]